MDDPFPAAGRSLYQRGAGHHLHHDTPAPAGGDLAVSGVHALLFDDDTNAAFVNSPAALLPWNGDQSLLIDRYDVRHLLQDLSGIRKRRPAPPLVDVTEEELNRERFRDLDEAGQVLDDAAQAKELSKPVANGYGAVQFSYSEKRVENGIPAESGNGSPSFYPPFPVPDFLLTKLPPSQKMHQIISGTAKFVSEHGGQSEIVLKVKQGKNPMFGFLNPDHYLHEYYRYLVNNKELTGGVVKERAGSADDGQDPGEGLSLLGSAYGTGDEDDENEDRQDGEETSVNERAASSESRLPSSDTEVKASKALELVGASIKLSSDSDVQVKKNAKVSLNLKNEKVGVHSTTPASIMDSLSPEQGKGTLGDTKGLSKSLSQPGKKKIFVEKKEFIQPNKNNVSHLINVQANHGTGGSSEDLVVTARGKLRTVSESKTSLMRTSSNASTDVRMQNKLPMQSSNAGEYGMTADAAAAVVLAATRGARWAKQDASNMSSSSGPSQKVSNLSKEASSEVVKASEKAARTALSEVSAATAVAQAAAVAAAHEADSADAHLSPAEKLKAERLRRAKIFAAMIKSGENVSQFTREPAIQSMCRHSLDNETVGSGSNVMPSDVARADKHVPYRDQLELVALKAKGVRNEHLHSKKEDSGEGTSYEHHPNKRMSSITEGVAEIDYGKSKKLNAEDNEARDYNKKKVSQESPSLDEKERDSNEGDKSHSKSRKHDRDKHHRSERKEQHRSKRHRSEADDQRSHDKKKSHHRHRKQKCHDDDYSDSEDDDDKQRHHKHRNQRLSSPGERPSSTKNSIEELQIPALVKQEKLSGSSDDAVGSGNSIHESAHTVTAVDVPDDIRAKVRAMLLSNIL